MDNIETTQVALTVGDDTDATHVVTTGDDGSVARLELDHALDLARLQVKTDGVVNTELGVGEADGAAVVGDDEGNATGTQLHLSNLAQLVLGLLLTNTVNNETALGVVQETESLTGLLQLDDVHEARGVVGISANLTVDLDVTVHDDAANFALVQSVLQTVAEQDDERQALAQLVGTGRGARGKGAGQLVQHPRLGGSQSFQVLLRSASLNSLLMNCSRGGFAVGMMDGW